MKNWNRIHKLILFLAVAGLFLLGNPARGLMPEINLEALTEEASHIVLGNVADIVANSADHDSTGVAYLYADIQVEEVIKGRLTDDQVRVRFLTEQGDDLTLWVEDDPELVPGQAVLAFLVQIESGLFTFAGGVQGVMEPAEEIVARVKAILAASEPEPNLALEIATDRERYETDEQIIVSITATNYGERSATLQFRSSLQADYVIEGIYCWSQDRFFAQALTSVTIAAGASHTWELVHLPGDAQLLAGLHRVVGFVVGYPSLRAETEITVGHMARVEGVVLDSEGNPIAGAQVVAHRKFDVLEPIFGPSPAEEPEGVIRSSSPVPRFRVFWAETDESGRFSLENVPVGDTLLVAALKQDYNPASTEVSIDSELVSVTLTLDRLQLGRLEGLVLDSSARPVSDARVEVTAYSDWSWPDIRFEDLASSAEPGLLYRHYRGLAETPPGELPEDLQSDLARFIGPVPAYTFSARTVENGSFAVDGVPIDFSLQITARKEGHYPANTTIKMDAALTSARLFLVEREMPGFANSVAEIRNGICYQLATDKFHYADAEDVTVRYRVVNLDRDSVRLEFPTSQDHEFVLLSPEGDEIWRWSGDKSFILSMHQVDLARGESLEFTETISSAVVSADSIWAGGEDFAPWPWVRGLVLKAYLPLAESGEMGERETEIWLKFTVEGDEIGTGTADLGGSVAKDMGPLDVWVPLAGVKIVANRLLLALPPETDDAVELFRAPEDSLCRKKYVAVTDEQGRFLIEDVPVGAYEVAAFKEGYRPASRIVRLRPPVTNVSFLLSEIDTEIIHTNISYFIRDEVRHELSTDRHFYGPDDTVNMRYEVVNLKEIPITVEWQGHSFAVEDAAGEIWQSAQRATVASAQLRTGESLSVIETLDLKENGITEGGLTLLGHLVSLKVDSAQVPEEETIIALGLVVAERYEIVDLLPTGQEAAVDARESMGVYLRLRMASEVLGGAVELNVTDENRLGELPGYLFLKMAEFNLDPARAAFIENAWIEIYYDEQRLSELGVDEQAVELFYWDAAGLGWSKLEVELNTEDNFVTASLPKLAPVALFANSDYKSGEGNSLSTSFLLLQNYPNPFNPATTIRFVVPDLGQQARVNLAVFNVLGQKVRTLINERFGSGQWGIQWDGKDDRGQEASSGVYFYQLRANDGEWVKTRRMLLTR